MLFLYTSQHTVQTHIKKFWKFCDYNDATYKFMAVFALIIGASPIELTVEEEGGHVLKVIPQDCERKRTQTFRFNIEWKVTLHWTKSIAYNVEISLKAVI